MFVLWIDFSLPLRAMEEDAWWKKAEKPFQCLATCQEIAKAMRPRPPYPWMKNGKETIRTNKFPVRNLDWRLPIVKVFIVVVYVVFVVVVLPSFFQQCFLKEKCNVSPLFR